MNFSRGAAAFRHFAAAAGKAREARSGVEEAIGVGIRRQKDINQARLWMGRIKRHPVKVAALTGKRLSGFAKRHPIASASIAVDVGLQGYQLAKDFHQWRARRRAQQAGE